MTDKILSFLNEEQIEAVQKPLLPVLVIAGPGTGKTRLLTSRIAWLIEEHQIPPEKILAVTFTNKAALEMKSRLQDLIGQKGKDVLTSTFHSFALSLIRKYYSRLQLDQFFSVCDQDYQQRLLINLCAPYIKENLELKVKGILLSISNYIIRGKSLSSFAGDRFDEYQHHLKKHSLIDFDQIVRYCQVLLTENDDVCEEYRHLYPAILVDEFQDTDPVQYDIIKMLAQKNKNIFVVADDDQSIYTWRGANPENIKKYMTDFSITDPVFLQINYRNGDKILTNAHRIIRHTDRIEPAKKLKVDKAKSNDINLNFFYNEVDEVNFILSKIHEWIEEGIPYGEIAIIYPFHKIGQSLEHFIIKKEIPYQMATGKSILENPLIGRMVLYLNLIRDPDDSIGLEELARVELGESLFGLIKHLSQQQKATFRQILYKFYKEKEGNLPYDSLLKIRNFIAHIANLVNLKGFFTFHQIVNEIFMETDPQDQSFLFQYRKVLDNFTTIQHIPGLHLLNDLDKNLFVYHSDRRISFLASRLLGSILSRKTQIIEAAAEDDLDAENDLLLELEPSPLKISSDQKVPVYMIKNEKREGSLSCLFKFCQWLTSKQDNDPFQDYVVLDLETTDKDKDSCGIVEIAAVRVKNNKITAELNSLINPQMPISKGAQNIHHISDKDVKNAPTIEQFWPEFIDFIDNTIMIAHNGYNFDFPILDRYSKKISGKKLPNIRIDTLVIARNLFPLESNSIDSLIQRFELKADKRHRALDDVLVLVEIMQKLQSIRLEISRLTSLEMFLDLVSLGNFIENKISGDEDRLFFFAGGRKLQSAYSKIRTDYAETFGENEVKLRERIHERLYQLNPRLITYKNNEHLLNKIKQLAAQYEKVDFDEAIANFLSYLSLNSSQDQLENINAISLLTYHSAKGLEFDKVILMGMENKNMPGFHALRNDTDDDRPISKKLEEQRRLFYVGMTRAKSELVLTAVKNRGGWEHESSPFLKDLKVSHTTVKM